MRANEADLAIYRRPSDRPLPLVMKMAGNGEPDCKIVCGFLGCDARPFNPMLEALPQIMHAPMSDVSRGWISSLIRVAADETELGSPGSEAMLARLAELIYSSKYCANISTSCPRIRAAGSRRYATDTWATRCS
jgi:Cupin